jgi:hypothetical protein
MQASMGSAPPDAVERTTVAPVCKQHSAFGAAENLVMRLCHTPQVLAFVRCRGSCPSPDAPPTRSLLRFESEQCQRLIIVINTRLNH